MELGTFGAVMGWAARLAQQSSEFYETASRSARNPELKALVQALAQEAQKDVGTMEQTRRENVTEMILAPIAGLRQEAYALDVPGAAGAVGVATDAEIVQTALKLEERDTRFFRDASERVPLPEVARVFRRAAQKKTKRVNQLQGVVLHE